MGLTKTGVLLLDSLQFRKGRFPLLFQGPRDKAVLRLDSLVLPSGTIGIVTGSFQPLLPSPFQPASLLLQIIDRTET